MKTKRLLVLIIVIIFLVGGGFLIYKYAFKDKEDKNTSSQGGNSDNLPSNSDGKLTQAELEKYLLEKRLDLQKYFVFNLGKELRKRERGESYSNLNQCKITSELARDLTKLTSLYTEKLKQKGYKLKPGGLISKQWITFVSLDFGNIKDNEWLGEDINRKIENGKDKYIIFEKEDEFENVFFHKDVADNQGRLWYRHWGSIFLRIKGSTTYICESKEKALEILKNDPVLVGKV